uniref:Ubiquitin-like protease family profile domain-containing protein n=1 Tax=Clastoptera arizonana TaxID=38151 RepID=A0A1B6DLD8_9HEMI
MPKKEDPVILSYKDSLIRQSDLNILSGPFWLNDAIIEFYFEYIQNETSKSEEILLISPAVTQCLKGTDPSQVSVFLDPLQAKEKKLICLAVNDCENFNSPGGSHWSLLVFSKYEKTFYHFDSSTGSNYQQAQKVVSNICDYFNCSDELSEEKTLQQSNSYDCGIHLLCCVKNIATHAIDHEDINELPQISRSCVAGMRNDITYIIKHLASNI